MHRPPAKSFRDSLRYLAMPLFAGALLGNSEKDDYPVMYRDDDKGAPNAFKLMLRVGKKAAGAVLDGREHREFPA